MRDMYGPAQAQRQLAANGGPIIAQLIDSNVCEALGVTAESSSPLIALCRKLVEAGGHDPRLPLQAYRGATLALIVTSIGVAADREISGGGIGFIRRCERRVGPPMRFSERAGP